MPKVELDNSPPAYCERNCIKACDSRNVELISYTYNEQRCECSCTKNLHAIFGIDYLRN